MIVVVDKAIPLVQLKEMAAPAFGNLIKGVVDISKKCIAINGELHADEEAYLKNRGSKQNDLWGINIYPDLPFPDRIEFDSMINIRPQLGNRSRGVDDPVIQDKIIEIVKQLIKE